MTPSPIHPGVPVIAHTTTVPQVPQRLADDMRWYARQFDRMCCNTHEHPVRGHLLSSAGTASSVRSMNISRYGTKSDTPADPPPAANTDNRCNAPEISCCMHGPTRVVPQRQKRFPTGFESVLRPSFPGRPHRTPMPPQHSAPICNHQPQPPSAQSMPTCQWN